MKKNNEKKERTISFRVTKDDEREILEKAQEAKVSISTFCRRKAKGVVVKAPTPLPAVADRELVVFAKKIAENLKEIKECGKEIDEDVYKNLSEMIDRLNNRMNNVGSL